MANHNEKRRRPAHDMTMGAIIPPPVPVFYSASHKDRGVATLSEPQRAATNRSTK